MVLLLGLGACGDVFQPSSMSAIDSQHVTQLAAELQGLHAAYERLVEENSALKRATVDHHAVVMENENLRRKLRAKQLALRQAPSSFEAAANQAAAPLNPSSAVQGGVVGAPMQTLREVHKLRDENKSLRQQVLQLNALAKSKEHEAQRLLSELGQRAPLKDDITAALNAAAQDAIADESDAEPAPNLGWTLEGWLHDVDMPTLLAECLAGPLRAAAPTRDAAARAERLFLTHIGCLGGGAAAVYNATDGSMLQHTLGTRRVIEALLRDADLAGILAAPIAAKASALAAQASARVDALMRAEDVPAVPRVLSPSEAVPPPPPMAAAAPPPPPVMGAGKHLAQGDKEYMEDFAVATRLTTPLAAGAPLLFAAVFDGHNGGACAQYAASRLHVTLAQGDQLAAGDVGGALRAACHQTSADFLVSAPDDASGTTAVVAVVVDGVLHVANVGDSRAVLWRDGQGIAITTDHKPDDPIERERIEAAGGEIDEDWGMGGVTSPQGDGYLKCARSLGDRAYKPGDEPSAHLIPAEADLFSIPLTPSDAFVVLASDGVWDVLSSEAAAEVVQSVVSDPAAAVACDATCDAAAKALVEAALANGSDDNVSASVLVLAARAAAPPPSALALIPTAPQPASTPAAPLTSLVAVPTAPYGKLSMFYSGLSALVGLTDPGVLTMRAMHLEHCHGPDALVPFESGAHAIRSNSTVEWWFVYDPEQCVAAGGPNARPTPPPLTPSTPL